MTPKLREVREEVYWGVDSAVFSAINLAVPSAVRSAVYWAVDRPVGEAVEDILEGGTDA